MNIGLDLGYSATKVVAKRTQATFPSVVGSPDKARFSFSENGDALILTSPAHVAVGDSAVVQSRFLNRREDRHWIESDTYYRLALAALTEVTRGTKVSANIVTGLPVAYLDDKDLLKDLLSGEHRVQREGRRAQTFDATVRVIPQPFGTLLSEALNERGGTANADLLKGTVGIIGCGGKTTNLLSVYKASEVGHETDSVNVGAWDAVKVVRRWLTANCPDLSLRDHRIVDAIIARTVNYHGESQDLSGVVDETLASMAEQVIAAAGQLWNGAGGLDAILVSGGGALLLGPAIKEHFPRAVIVEDPIFANARGYYYFAQHLAAQGKW